MIDLASVPEHSRRAASYNFFRLLVNDRIRYYGAYKVAKSLGRTAGARSVVEVEVVTGKPIRTWYESYDDQGRVIRIHPKTPTDLGHIEIDPLTGREIKMVKSKQILKDLEAHLQRVANHTLTSESLALWAEEQYWLLMEGQGKNDHTPEVNFLREILSDVAVQWECLLGNTYDTFGREATSSPEFAQEWITDWSLKVALALSQPIPITSPSTVLD